jgi:hypothetical protein
MGAFDFQMGAIDEVTFNTPLTVTRFFEYNGDAVPFKPIAGRTEGDPLRLPSRVRRQLRVVPFMDHVEGTLPLDVMTKDFSFWLKHMFGSVVTAGAGPFTHTATEGPSSALVGKSFTAQVNMPFHPTGTNQSLTISGGKVPKWKLSAAVDEMVTCELDIWAASMTTATGARHGVLHGLGRELRMGARRGDHRRLGGGPHLVRCGGRPGLQPGPGPDPWERGEEGADPGHAGDQLVGGVRLRLADPVEPGPRHDGFLAVGAIVATFTNGTDPDHRDHPGRTVRRAVVRWRPGRAPAVAGRCRGVRRVGSPITLVVTSSQATA